MKTLNIKPGTILTYVCEFTGNVITEIFENVTEFGNYQMKSCASYSADEILKMKVVSGEVLQLIDEGEVLDVDLEELLSDEYKIAKKCKEVINSIGCSLSDATDTMKVEYRKAKNELSVINYRMELGNLIKIN